MKNFSYNYLEAKISLLNLCASRWIIIWNKPNPYQPFVKMYFTRKHLRAYQCILGLATITYVGINSIHCNYLHISDNNEHLRSAANQVIYLQQKG